MQIQVVSSAEPLGLVAPFSGTAGFRTMVSQIVLGDAPSNSVWSANPPIQVGHFAVNFWPAGPDLNNVITLNSGEVPSDSIDKLATYLQSKMCIDLPDAWDPDDPALYDPKLNSDLFALFAYDGKTGQLIIVPVQWAPNVSAHRVCAVFVDGGQVKASMQPVMAAFQDEITSGITATVGIQTPIGSRTAKILTITVASDFPFVGAHLLDDSKHTLNSIDINVPIDRQVAWVCLEPKGTPPKQLPVRGTRVVVADIRGRALLTASAPTINFQLRDSQFVCATVSGNMSLANDGLASDDVSIYVDGQAVGTIAQPSYESWRILGEAARQSFVVAGASLALCSSCKRSFVPSSVTTVRAVVPLLEFNVGVPKVFSFRADLGVSPGLLVGSDAANSVEGGGFAPVGALCLAIESSSAPRLCAMAAADFVFVSTTPAGATSADLHAGILLSGMALVGITIP
jgi:hypothetical protein